MINGAKLYQALPEKLEHAVTAGLTSEWLPDSLNQTRTGMPDQFQFDVFLSHSAKDKAVVRDVAARLQRDGVRVWLDEEQIKPGDSIPAKIEAGLERAWRQRPTQRSAMPFCQGDWTLVRLDSRPVALKNTLTSASRSAGWEV